MKPGDVVMIDSFIDSYVFLWRSYGRRSHETTGVLKKKSVALVIACIYSETESGTLMHQALVLCATESETCLGWAPVTYLVEV